MYPSPSEYFKSEIDKQPDDVAPETIILEFLNEQVERILSSSEITGHVNALHEHVAGGNQLPVSVKNEDDGYILSLDGNLLLSITLLFKHSDLGVLFDLGATYGDVGSEGDKPIPIVEFLINSEHKSIDYLDEAIFIGEAGDVLFSVVLIVDSFSSDITDGKKRYAIKLTEC